MFLPQTIGSLFSGIGGLELGLERATEAQTIWSCEIDPLCRQVLAKHWPHAIQYTDVKKIGEVTPKVDLLCGGFPCQNLSVSGDRQGLAGDRSGLWSEFSRIIGVLQPSYVMIENVPALLHFISNGMGRVLGELVQHGYDVEWDCIPATAVGAPHVRDRVFILGRRRDLTVDPGVNTTLSGPVNFDFPPSPSDDQTMEWFARYPGAQPGIPRDSEPTFKAMLRTRRQRLKMLGNAVVPQVASLAWELLSQRLETCFVDAFISYEEERQDWVESQSMLSLLGDTETETFRKKWPRAGGIRGHHACVRTAAHIPSAEERLWPTPAASLPNDGEEPAQWLTRFVKHATGGTKATRAGVPLAVAARAPIVLRVARIGKIKEALELLARHAVSPFPELASRDVLNPTWVESLMGFPTAWTFFDEKAMVANL